MDAESFKLALNGKLGLDTEGQERAKFKDVKASCLHLLQNENNEVSLAEQPGQWLIYL